ncbi:MAG: acyl-CoA thioesterase [Parachlamydiales bacterium]|jgi:acyl-CoA thioester hydrolase
MIEKPAKKYTYSLIIKEANLDVYGHVNNTVYLTLFEEARWQIITDGGYGLDKIKETGKGPVILDIHVRYHKEIHLRELIVIESQFLSYEKKIGKIHQRMMRGDDVCCTADYTTGLFDLGERRLILPTEEWLNAIGYNI